MRRPGRIVDIPGPGRAIVELDAAAACARCAAGRGCGAALFAPRGHPLRLDCLLEATPGAVSARTPSSPIGARAEVTLPEDGARWLVPVMLAYGLPTVGLLLGALAPEPWTPLTALAGLGGGLLAWRACNGWLVSDAVRDVGPRASGAGGPGPCRPVARIAPHGDSRSSEGEHSA